MNNNYRKIEARIAEEIMGIGSDADKSEIRHTDYGETFIDTWSEIKDCPEPYKSMGLGVAWVESVPHYITDSNYWDSLVDKFAEMGIETREKRDAQLCYTEFTVLRYLNKDHLHYGYAEETREEARSKAIEELLDYLKEKKSR